MEPILFYWDIIEYRPVYYLASIHHRAKKNDWEREKATLELKMDTKAREVQLQQESIDRKNQEVRTEFVFFHHVYSLLQIIL